MTFSSPAPAAPPAAAPAPAPRPHDRWFMTLKARIALGAMAAISVGVALTTWHMSRVAEADLVAVHGLREHAEAQRMAAVIGRRVAEMQRALRVVGEQMQRRQLDDAPALERFLDDRPVLRATFANVAVAGADGRLRVLVDAAGPRRPVLSLNDREYFQRAMASGRAVISDPIEGRVSDEPIVIFGQPLADGQGRWGLLIASVRLTSRDLIEDLSEARSDDNDMLLVVTDGAGRIIAHPQRARIMAALDSEPRLAAAARGWAQDGRPLIRDAGAWDGTGDVVAMAADPVSGWHLWRASSKQALLAPLRSARSEALGMAAALAALLSALLVAFLVWQLRPLSRLERRAARLLEGDAGGPWPAARGEVGALSRTLQHVWSERARAERANAIVMRRLSSVMAASPVGLAFVRAQRFELVSDECGRLLKCTAADLVGEPARRLFATREDFARFRDAARRAFAGGAPYEGECRLRAADGSVFWARLHARPVAADEPAAGSIWSLHNIDEQVSARSVLEHAALHDPLTGLLNRSGLAVRLAALCTEHDAARPAALLMLDLDRFKAVNDEGGHAAGDAMLQRVARVLVQHLRASDAVARIGGDEFAVLLPGCDAARAVAVAEKIHAGVGDIVLAHDSREFRVGVSVGLAERPPQATPEGWLAVADAACYEAKRAGRNAVRVAAGGAQAG